MEFQVICPNDGPVEVGLENISSIVVRGDQDVDVVFKCPRCGQSVSVSAQIPRMLLATLADTVVVDEESGEVTLSVSALMERGRVLIEGSVQMAEGVQPSPVQAVEDDLIEPYCEYFRRQLAGISSVEAMLEEIDAK